MATCGGIDLGQCVYEMSTGKRCPKAAETVLFYGGGSVGYGYCTRHSLSATQIRPHRRHYTAEALPADTIQAREYELHERNVRNLASWKFSGAEIADDDLWALGDHRVMDGLKALHAYGVTDPDRIVRLMQLVVEAK